VRFKGNVEGEVVGEFERQFAKSQEIRLRGDAAVAAVRGKHPEFWEAAEAPRFWADLERLGWQSFLRPKVGGPRSFKFSFEAGALGGQKLEALTP